MGNWGQSQIIGLLGNPAIPKSRGVWLTPKRYVGHTALGSNSRPHPEPSWTCAPIAPTMSVRIFGRFLPFPIVLARRALCSAPPCMPDAWTNGPHMVCSLCTLVPMTQTPRGETKVLTHKELCQGKRGQFCDFGTCGYISGHHHAMAHGDPWHPSKCGPTFDSHWLPNRTLSSVSKPSWRNTLGDTFNVSLFIGMLNVPFWDPNFSFYLWSIRWPISFSP